MIQKEVADRMAASPGTKDYGSLSIAVQFYCSRSLSRSCRAPSSCRSRTLILPSFGCVCVKRRRSKWRTWTSSLLSCKPPSYSAVRPFTTTSRRGSLPKRINRSWKRSCTAADRAFTSGRNAQYGGICPLIVGFSRARLQITRTKCLVSP